MSQEKQFRDKLEQKNYNKINRLFIDAVGNNNHKLVEEYIQKGADINYIDYMGNTALIIAAGCGYCSTIKLLLKHHADVNVYNHEGTTPLIAAAKCGSSEIIKLLLDYNPGNFMYKHNLCVDIHANDVDKLTALDWAIKRHHYEVVEILRKYGAERKFEPLTIIFLFIICIFLLYIQMWGSAITLAIVTIYLYERWD